MSLDRNFDAAVYLGSGTAPKTGSFVGDTFTDTDGTSLSAHTGEVGASWSAAGNITFGGQMFSNRVRGTSIFTRGAKASGTPATAEYDVAADLVFVTDILNRDNGVFGRQVAGIGDANNTRYEAFHRNHFWTLRKWVANTNTTLGTFQETVGDGPTKALVLELRDAAKKVYVDDVELISSSDNDITGAGFAGLFLGDNSDTTGVHLDNFTATDASPPPPPTGGFTRMLMGVGS